MKFSIDQKVLKNELTLISGVIETRSTIPILANVFIESLGDNTIRLTATDLDITLRCDAEAVVEEGGKVCILARKLFDIVSALGEETLRFESDENGWLRLKASTGNYRLPGIDPNQYPETNFDKSTPLELPAAIMSDFIQNTSFAISNDISRYTLSGAKFEFDGRQALMVATDGHRLALIRREIEGRKTAKTEKIDVLIPRKVLRMVHRIASGTIENIHFGEGDNMFFFEFPGRLIASRKLNGNFPNYEMVLPKTSKGAAEFDLNEMRGAVHRISLLDRVADGTPLRMTIKSGKIEITNRNTDVGEGLEIINADYEGEEIAIGFNSKYLIDFFSNVGSLAENAAEEAETASAATEDGAATARAKATTQKLRGRLEFTEPNAAAEFGLSGEKDYEYRYIVMPLRI